MFPATDIFQTPLRSQRQVSRLYNGRLLGM
jgi:hypothetical protein